MKIIVKIVCSSVLIVSLIPLESVEASVQPLPEKEEVIIEPSNTPETAEARSQSLVEDFKTIISEDFGFLQEVGTFIEGLTDTGGLFGILTGGSDSRSIVSDALEQVGLSEIFGGINEFLTEVGTYIEGDLWGVAEKALGIEVNRDVMGMLGLPDPNQILGEIEAALRGEKYGANGELPGESSLQLEAGLEGYGNPKYSFLLEKRLESYSLYEQSDQLADQALSVEGQERIKKQQTAAANVNKLIQNLAQADQDMVAASESLANDSLDLSNDSESTDVTQNIMRNQSTQLTYQTQALVNQSAQMANQSAQMAQIGALQQQQVMQGYDAQITRAYQSKLLSDLAKQEQRKATVERRQNVAASRRAQMQGAISGFGGTIGNFNDEEKVEEQED